MLSFFVFILWLVLFVRFFIFNPYTVIWQSMSPTYHQNDFIIVDKISNTYSRWDIIVFVPPWKDIPYIKRIIWLPWETIKINNWNVLICDKENNCEKLIENYLPFDLKTINKCGITEFDITEWTFFVMWDNRNHSTDSRCCFSIWCYSWSEYLLPDSHIIGKVLFRIYKSE
jgi:signal peptidase I